MSNLGMRIGQALNIACEFVTAHGSHKKPKFWEQVEEFLPECYNNLERLHKKQTDAIENPPQAERGTYTFQNLKEIVPTFKTVEDLNHFRKIHKDLLASLTKEQKDKLKQLTKIG